MKWYQFSLRKFILVTLLVGLLLSEIKTIHYRLPYYEMNGGIWVDFRHIPIAFGITKRSNEFGGKWGYDIDYR